MCYVEGVAVYRKEPLAFTPEDVDPFACTHVMYAFASIDPHTYQIMPRDEEYDVVQGTFTLIYTASCNIICLLHYRSLPFSDRFKEEESTLESVNISRWW